MKGFWIIVYYFVVIPIGFIKKILKQDKLSLKIDKNMKSYRNVNKTTRNAENHEEKSDECPDTNYPMW